METVIMAGEAIGRSVHDPPGRRVARRPVRIVRIVARLNVGGPAIQAITLTDRLRGRGYATRLVRGRESAAAGSMDYLARELGVDTTLIGSLRRDPGLGDLRAIFGLARLLRRDRPWLVHTHAARAGTFGGRRAALDLVGIVIAGVGAGIAVMTGLTRGGFSSARRCC